MSRLGGVVETIAGLLCSRRRVPCGVTALAFASGGWTAGCGQGGGQCLGCTIALAALTLGTETFRPGMLCTVTLLAAVLADVAHDGDFVGATGLYTGGGEQDGPAGSPNVRTGLSGVGAQRVALMGRWAAACGFKGLDGGTLVNYRARVF